MIKTQGRRTGIVIYLLVLVLMSVASAKDSIYKSLSKSIQNEMIDSHNRMIGFARTGTGAKIFNDELLRITDGFIDLRKAETAKDTQKKLELYADSKIVDHNVIPSNGFKASPQGVIITKPDGRMVVKDAPKHSETVQKNATNDIVHHNNHSNSTSQHNETRAHNISHVANTSDHHKSVIDSIQSSNP